MKYLRASTVLVFLVVLCLFTACGAVELPSVGNRPQTDGESVTYEPPARQTAVSDVTAEKEPPAYWRGQSQTLPGETEDTLTPTSSGEEPSGTSDSGTSTPTTESEPPQTTPQKPDFEGEGRGDAYDVIGTNTNGVTVTIQCTPFY